MYYRVGWMWALSESLWCVTWNTWVLVGSVSPCKEHNNISLQEVTWKGRVSLSQCECDELCKEQDNVRTFSCAELRKQWRGIVVSFVIGMCHSAFCPSFSVSSWFSLLLHCINSSHSFPAAFFSHMFSLYAHSIFEVWYLQYVDGMKIGWKENLDPLWKVLNKEVDLWEPTSLLDHIYLGCTQSQCDKQRYCGQLQNHVRIENLSGEDRKTSILSKSSNTFMVLRHGWSCKEVCGTILWVGKQDDATTLQSIYSLHRWPPL